MMSELSKRAKLAREAIDSLPDWAKVNLYFAGGEIQPGHEALHQVPDFEMKPGAKVSKAKLMNTDRNALCPCSSGRKFKKCCINKK